MRRPAYELRGLWRLDACPVRVRLQRGVRAETCRRESGGLTGMPAARLTAFLRERGDTLFCFDCLEDALGEPAGTWRDLATTLRLTVRNLRVEDARCAKCGAVGLTVLYTTDQ